MQTAARMATASATFLSDESGLSLMEATLVGLLVGVIILLALLALQRAP
jgi:Tfp pilus assembly protein PilV